ncbi:putative GTP pyrophosphokinase [Lachnobacterium bovis]|uniref:Putative GTP pyrophosphokinase n=1 Tax=Lachnobacterium bovis TaxID=140626 RepID=A0A1H9UQY9_9FIRM|nr:GTP pyrophosphokinase family protein [Lachnobacterium bovis]SES11806.1 putative GTP pyrophosphokinase [Lachnobacterium bovis]
MDEILNQVKEKWIKENLLSDKVLETINANIMPIERFMAYYRCAIMEVETKFKVLNEQFSLQYDRNPIESIKTRVKSVEGIIKKITKKNIPLSLEAIEENITDIAGVRVICSFPEDIYYLADCLLQQDDITLIKKKDYIKNPKPSGYRSLHLIVEVPIFLENQKRPMKVEVQLRTIAMDFWASLEHKLQYKKDIPASEVEYLSKELEECASISASLDERMEKIRNRMNNFAKEVDETDNDYKKVFAALIRENSNKNGGIINNSQNLAQDYRNMLTYNKENYLLED